jgi:hypothetical protein
MIAPAWPTYSRLSVLSIIGWQPGTQGISASRRLDPGFPSTQSISSNGSPLMLGTPTAPSASTSNVMVTSVSTGQDA